VPPTLGLALLPLLLHNQSTANLSRDGGEEWGMSAAACLLARRSLTAASENAFCVLGVEPRSLV
jgi:hypothetical protein